MPCGIHLSVDGQGGKTEHASAIRQQSGKAIWSCAVAHLSYDLTVPSFRHHLPAQVVNCLCGVLMVSPINDVMPRIRYWVGVQESVWEQVNSRIGRCKNYHCGFIDRHLFSSVSISQGSLVVLRKPLWRVGQKTGLLQEVHNFIR